MKQGIEIFALIATLAASVLGVYRATQPTTINLIGAAVPDVQLVVYGAPWCKPCERYEANLKKEMTEKDGWILRDVKDKDASTAHLLFDKREDPKAMKADKIEAFPTTVLKKNGVIVKRWTGAVPPDELVKAFNDAGTK